MVRPVTRGLAAMALTGPFARLACPCGATVPDHFASNHGMPYRPVASPIAGLVVPFMNPLRLQLPQHLLRYYRVHETFPDERADNLGKCLA